MKTILLVEDDRALNSALAYDLEAESYKVRSAFTLGEGFEADGHEYKVLAVIGTATSLDMCYSKGGYEAITFAEPVFLNMFPDMQNPIHCIFNAADGTFDDLNEQIKMLAKQKGLSATTRLTAEEQFKEMKKTYSMVGFIVSGILGILLSALLSVTLVKNLAAGLWFMSYHFTILPAVAVSAICLLLAAGISALGTGYF